MMGKGHAVSGIAVWWGGWSWTALAGYSHPRPDVIIVGGLVASGAALLPDFDHPKSRIAHAGGRGTRATARMIAYLGRNIHHITKLDADRPDEDGHRTISHTFAFAVLAGLLPAGAARLAGWAGGALNRRTGWDGWDDLFDKLLLALTVFAFVKLGFAAARAAFPGKQRKVKLAPGGRRRWRKATAWALISAAVAVALTPAQAWWIGLAITVGCATHCLGDVITASGCPIVWPVPIPARELRYNPKTRVKEPVWRWRTWYLVGTPRCMRFRVGTPTETWVTRAIIAFGVFAGAVLVYTAAHPPVAG